MRSLRFGLLLAVAALGCGRGEPKVIVIERPAAPPEAVTTAWTVHPPKSEPTADDRYDANLASAARSLAEQNYDAALRSLESARQLRDSDEVRDAIALTRGRLERRAAADRAVADIQVVIRSRPDEAARLAADALEQYGDTSAAEALSQLRRRAEALDTADTDAAERRDRLRREAETLLASGNWRAAAVALEQAVAAGPDAALLARLGEVRERLSRYDELRARAARLGPDDALAALRQAAAIWDTDEVRRDIEAITLARMHRRPRVAVLPFELRVDVGQPDFGRTVADSLVPALKTRFDVVELQLHRVLDELQIRPGDLIRADVDRRQFAGTLGADQLIVGSIDWVGGVAIRARLIDAATGIVIQTGQVVGRTPEEAASLVSPLAALLKMNDDQRLAYEHELARRSAAVPMVGVAAVPAGHAIVPFTPRPCDPGGLQPTDFDRIPLAEAAPPTGAFAVKLAADSRTRIKLLGLALELGDDLVRRGKPADAARQFQLALALAPGRADVQARLDRCRPNLPPGPLPIAAPRLAVIDFVPVGDVSALPPNLGAWTAEQLGPYLGPPGQVADRGEVGWYMARLGLTLRDVVVDPDARAALAHAIHCRTLVTGTLRPGPGGIEVAAHWIDAEFGTRLGTAAIVVAGVPELRWRLGELGRLLLDPAERLRWQHGLADADALVRRAEENFHRGDFATALDLFRAALGLRPQDGRILARIREAERQAELARWEAERQAVVRREREFLERQRQAQLELARRTELARRQAERLAREQAEAEQLRRREETFRQFVQQARQAADRQDLARAVALLESALELRRDEAIARELAGWKATLEEQARRREAEARAAREREVRERREAEIARIRREAEQKRRETDAAFERLLANARANLGSRQPQAAIPSLEEALRLKPDDPQALALLREARDADADRLRREQTRDAQFQRLLANARANVRARQFPAAIAALEEALQLKPNDPEAVAALKEARDGASADSARAKREQDADAQFQRLMANAAANMKERQYAVAIAALEEALKIKPNHPVATASLREARDAVTRDKSRDAQQTETAFQRLLANARSNIRAKQFPSAIAALEEALELKPNDSQARALLKEAKSGAEAAARRDGDFDKLIANAQANLRTNQFATAIAALEEALELKPKDPTAAALLQQAKAGLERKQRDDFDKLVRQGRDAIARKQYDEAIRVLTAAAKLPGAGPEATSLLEQARREKANADAAGKAKAADDKAKADAAGKATDDKAKAEAAARSAYNRAMGRGRAMLTAKRYDDAIQMFTEALQQMPNDREAARLKKQAEEEKAKSKSKG